MFGFGPEKYINEPLSLIRTLDNQELCNNSTYRHNTEVSPLDILLINVTDS